MSTYEIKIRTDGTWHTVLRTEDEGRAYDAYLAEENDELAEGVRFVKDGNVERFF